MTWMALRDEFGRGRVENVSMINGPGGGPAVVVGAAVAADDVSDGRYLG